MRYLSQTHTYIYISSKKLVFRMNDHFEHIASVKRDPTDFRVLSM